MEINEILKITTSCTGSCNGQACPRYKHSNPAWCLAMNIKEMQDTIESQKAQKGDVTDKNVGHKNQTREWLREVRTYRERIETAGKEIEYLERVNHPGKELRIQELESSIASMEETLNFTMKVIGHMSDPLARIIYTSRYIMGEKWQSTMINLGKMSDRNARFIHDKNFAEFKKIMAEERSKE